jgi:O-acetyl-ADP-ribose deacetylase (regulator of RNase III)
MIKFLKAKNIWKTKCEHIVIPVNCVGVAGKGLAYDFKMYCPNLHKHYVKLCKNNILKIEAPVLIENVDKSFNNDERDKIILFPTKEDWRNPSKICWIENGLKSLLKAITTESIALPKLGCGLGGLDWKQVKPLLEKYFKNYKGLIEIYE